MSLATARLDVDSHNALHCLLVPAWTDPQLILQMALGLRNQRRGLSLDSCGFSRFVHSKFEI